MRLLQTEILENSEKSVYLQCVFHSIRFKVNERLAVWDRWPFFIAIYEEYVFKTLIIKVLVNGWLIG